MIHGITSGASVAAAPPVPPDPNAVSLLHFDGSDGSTVFTDEAGIVWTPTGDAQLDISQSQFGPSSLLIDVTGDWIDATDAVFAVGSSADFTAECFVRPAVITSNHFVFSFGSGWGVYAAQFNGGWALFDGVASNVIEGGAGLATANVWHHVALVRSAGTFTLWVDGASIGSVANSTDFNVGNMRLGAHTTGAGFLNGWIDEWRFSNIARYTAPFSPPAAPFTDP